MNISRTIVYVCITFILFISYSCKKNCNCENEKPSKEKPGIISDCRIKSFEVWSENYFFDYDQSGNLLQMYISPGNIIVNIFEYDNKNRLIRYYQPGLIVPYFDRRAHYYYDAQDRISSDTSWRSGTIAADGTVQAYMTIINKYSYDEQDRIIKVEETALPHEGTPGWKNITEYVYDKNGNLKKDGAEYDDKPSLLRTNPILMFLERNYSMNNVYKAESYNSNGLPEKFAIPENSAARFSFLGLDMRHSVFTFDCR